MEKTIENIVKVIGEIKAMYKTEVIIDHHLPPLVNMETCETTGCAVELQLSTKYDYDDATLNGWKEKLQADDWCLRVRRNQLFVTFNVRYFVPTEKHIAKMAHAIGLDHKEPEDGVYEAYRNRALYDGPDELWDELAVAGYAARVRKGKEHFYYVMPKGFQLLAEHYQLLISYTDEYEGRR